MNERGRWLTVVCAAAGIVLLLFFSRECAAGVYDGMVLCGGTLIPALFPFLVVSELLAATLPCRRAYTAIPATILLSIVGGYPAGARAAERLLSRGLLTPRQAHRLALGCCNAGPAFLVSAVGAGMLSSRKTGFLLLGINLASMLLTVLLLFLLPERDGGQSVSVPPVPLTQPPLSPARVLPDAVERAVKAMLLICAYTLLFTALLGLCREFWGNGIRLSLLAAVLEVTNGCRLFARESALPVLCAICGFGGVCVLLQNASFAAGCGARLWEFALVRAVQALFAFLLSLPFSPDPLLPVFSATNTVVWEPLAQNASTSVAVFLLLAAIALAFCRLPLSRRRK